MKKFFAKHSVFLGTVCTFLLAISASAGTRCIAFVWHDEPEAPAFMRNQWENE